VKAFRRHPRGVQGLHFRRIFG